MIHAQTQRGTGGLDPPPPPEKIQNIGFLSNTGSDPLKKHKATKPAFNVGPSSASWHFADCPLIVDLDPSSHHHLKIIVKIRPPLTKLLGSAHVLSRRCIGQFYTIR